MKTQLQLISASDFHYDNDKSNLMRRMPLATAEELRNSTFPASNHALTRGSPTRANSSHEFKSLDGSTLRMAGLRREKHRRLLDFVLAYSKNISLSLNGQGFFIDRRKIAKAVIGHAHRYADVEALILEMQQIRVQYVKAGCDLEYSVGDVEPLCTGYKANYQYGEDTKPNGLDAALALRGLDAKTFNGMSFMSISGIYMDRFLTEVSLRYHPALGTLFRMSAVGASLARFALSNSWIRARPLNDILDIIGAGSGSGRATIIDQLINGLDAKHLTELGISIQKYKSAKDGITRNCVFYESEKAAELLVITSAGFHGANKTPQSS